MDRCSLKGSKILSFGVRVGPTSSQTTRGERLNRENTPRLREEARSTLRYGLKQDFLALKVIEHHRRCFSDKFLNPLALPFEGNSRDFGECKH